MMFKMSAMFMVFHVFVSMVIPWKAMNYTASYFVPHFRSHPTAVFSSSKAESPFTRESCKSMGTPWRTHGFAAISVQLRGTNAQDC